MQVELHAPVVDGSSISEGVSSNSCLRSKRGRRYERAASNRSFDSRAEMSSENSHGNGEGAVSRPTRHECADPTIHDPRSARSSAHEERSTIHPHPDALAHENAAAGTPRTVGAFPHEKLDAYRVALDLAALSKQLAAEIPRGHRSIADHMLRAASNTVLLLAEGANRRGAAQKRQRFVESRGECAEVAAAADLIVVLGIGAEAQADELKQLAARVSAMLTRLIARLE